MIFKCLSLFGIGMLVALTPCMLPMLGIMASILTGPDVPITGARGFVLASSYVISSSLCYAVLGAIGGLTGGYLQGLLHVPIVVVPMAILLVILALIQLDIIKLALSSFSVLDKIHIRRDSILGSSILGVLSVITLSPCVTPVVAGVLTYISSAGAIGVFSGAIQLFCLGLGMGVPIIILATMGAYLIPKAGKWMKYIKWFTSLILVGMAVHLVWGLVPNTGPVNNFNDLAYSRTRVAASIDATQSVFNITSVTGLNTAIKSAGYTPVLVIVHAKWCPECTKLIRDAKANSEVTSLLKKYIILNADITVATKNNRALQKMLGNSAVPLVVIYKNGVKVKSHLGYDGNISTITELLK